MKEMMSKDPYRFISHDLIQFAVDQNTEFFTVFLPCFHSQVELGLSSLGVCANIPPQAEACCLILESLVSLFNNKT